MTNFYNSNLDSRDLVIFDDDFSQGLQGWGQLVDTTTPKGVVGLSTYPTLSGQFALMLQTEDQTDAGGNRWGYCMGLKRLTRQAGVDKVKFTVWWAWKALHGQNTPRAIEWGLDTADADGARKFFKYRWLNYDEGGSTRATKFQMATGSSGSVSYTDVSGATYDVGYNENKANWAKLEMTFDIASNVYDGLRINGNGYGTLAASPSNALRAVTPIDEGTLAGFKNGMNFTCEVRNRTNTSSTKTWVFMDRTVAEVIQ